MPPTFHRRLVALLLSWSVPASSAWAAAPPVVVPPTVGPAPALSVVPGLGEALDRAAYEARSGRDDERHGGDDRKNRRDDKDDRDRDRGSRNRRPILIRCECVEDEGDGTYTAHFGYESENADSVTIKAGADNEIEPGPSRRDQPTRFAPGRSRGWPDAPFRLRFDGQPVAWKLKGPDGSVRRATAALHLPRCGAIPPPCANPFWGPKRFEVKARDDDKKDNKKDKDDNRDHDWDDRDHRGHKHKRGERCERDDDDDHHKHPTVYEETIVVPPDTAPPYRLTVVNGGPGLKQRVLLAAVFVDGKLVAGPLHLNPFVRQVTREVKLAASSRLKVRLVGLPGSYLTLSLCGGSAPPPTDTTPPTIGVADPSAGALLASNTPALRVTYADPAGAGAPSGVDPATLVVTLDGQDRTAWFTRGPSEATAVVPADAVLAEGGHHLEARIRDAAGNEGTAVPVDFRVDSRPPQVEITDPQAGTVLSASTVDVSGTVLDASAIVRVQVAGIDAVLTGTTFTAAGVPLGDGPEVTLEAEAEDEAGNVGRGSVVVRVDRRAPTVTITRPAEGDTVQGPVIEVEGTVDDDGDVRVEVNGTPEDPPPSLRAPRSFLAHVPITDGTTELTATARDGAGNSGTTVVTVRTDTVAPTLVIDEPGPDLVTKETSVHVSGTATDASGIASVTVDGVPAVVDAGGAFEADVPLGPEGEQTIVVVATDGAQNPATASVTVTIDRTPPPVFTIASPAADALVGTQPVLVQGTVEDPQLAGVTVDGVAATVTGMAWQVSLAGLGDGVHTLEAVARDRASNERSLSRDIRVDTAAPVVTIEQPDDQLLLKEAAVAVTGTVRDASLQSVRVNGLTAVVTGDPASPAGATFSVASLPLAEGVNPITAVAEDELGRQGSASISVMRDSLPPQVGLSAPPLLVRGHADKAVATADDGTGSGVASVEFLIDGQPVATLGQPPYELALEAPAMLASGQPFTVSARATDLAGNVSPEASREVTVVSEGMVVGQVLADATSLPLAGASVRLVGVPGAPSVTDARGRYSLPVESASALVVAEAADHTSVERELPVALGTGAVPVDARLTALATAVPVAPGGGSLEAGLPGSRLAVTIPNGAFPSTTDVHLTPLSAQGLPGLLPLGWSPLVAFDLRTQGGAPLVGPIAAQLTARDAAGKAATSFAGWPAAPVVLAEYQSMLHAWLLLAAGLEPTAGELPLTLPGAGAFALVVPDTGDPAPVVPAVGEALAGVPLAELPATAASRAVVEPAVLPPSGGTATGTLVVDSPLALPSGTVVQARVSEIFSLASGETASSEERPMDIVLFRAPCTGIGETGGVSSACPDAGAAQVAARVPLTPSRSFGTSELLEGTVHLDILAGRESARGTTGGVAPVVVEAGGARLSVAGMALPTDTVVSLEQPEDLSSFLPSDPAWEPVGEVHVDLSGAVLQLAAELQVPYSGPDGTFVVARVERVEGIPRIAVVALAALVGDKLVTQPSAILPGVTREGRHVFYRLSGPVGFVRGVTLDGTTGTKALVTASGPPFIAASEPTGDYVLTTWPAAAVTVDARVPGMPLQAQGGPVEVVAGEATALDLLLSGAVTTARVTPPNGAAGIAVNLRIEITPTVPLAPGSVAAATITLVRVSDGEAVPVRRVMGVGGRSLTVIPERKIADEYVPLEFATAYRLTVSGLEDTYGTGVAVPPTTFTTQVFTPPVLDVARLVFDVPDDNGVVKVHAPAGSYPSGTTILIVNSGNGVVLSLTADNDGAVDGELPASADDRLLVTITDPQGNAKTFERSQYLIDPLTGETAVGAGGGVVTSPDAPGFELRVPKDATEKAVRLKIKALLESDFSELPALPDAEFGAALEVTAPDKPTFKKEVDLAFPLSALPPPPPDKTPEEAYYSVVRELKGPSGETWFQSIDEAKVECPGGQATCDDSEKKVVTASFPFIGMVTTFGGLTAGFSFLALETSRYLVMRTYAGALPGRSPWGAITGRVLQPVPIAGKPGQYEYKGVAGCSVRREGIGTGEVLAETQPAGEGLELGRLTFNAPWFTGGSVLLKANCGGRDYTGTAYVISGGAVEAIQDDGVKRLIGSGNYQTIGYVNITLPVAAEPPTAPRVEIRIFEEDATGKRTDLKGVSVAGSPFQVGVRATGYVVRSVKIRGENQTLLVPDPLKNTKPKDPLAFDAILQDAFLPSGAGSYVIEATAMDPAQLTTVSGETVVQVLREPGGSTESVPGRPGVIAARTSPRDNARGVSVSAFPALDFTEPVKGIGPASVRLVPVGCAPPPAGSTGSGCTDTGASEDSPGDPVPLRILGLTTDTPPGSVELSGTEVPPPYVVSLTLQPLVSLSFGTKYRLELTDAITDEDGELLVPYTSRFSTFLPEEVGKSNEKDPPTVTGLVILGERGYVLETLHAGGVAGPQQSSLLRVYDVTDPVEPRDLTDLTTGSIPRETIAFPPRDIAGEEVPADDGSPSGVKLIAIATAPRTFYQVQGSDPYWTELKSTPANLFLYDVSDPDAKPRFAGAANITNNIVDGIPNRLFMQKDRIYAATYPKGIQVISIDNLRTGFETEPAGQELFDINKKLFAGGLNPGAIVLTIPVKDPTNGLTMPLNDLEAMDLQVWGVPRKVVAATGSRPQAGLVLADGVSPYFETGETTPKPLWLGPLAKDGSSLEWGGAIALTRINDIPHALVGGTGVIAGAGSQTLLAIVDLSPVAPAVPTGQPKPSPKVVAIVALPRLNGVGDILLIGNTAVVSGATGTSIDGQAGGAALVDLTDPLNPELVGYVAGVGSRMALGADEMLYSSARSFVKGTAGELEGVRSATLGEAALITKIDPDPILVSASNEVFRNVDLSYKTIPPAPGTGQVSIGVKGGGQVAVIPAEINESGTGTARWEQGTVINPLNTYEARLKAERDGQEMRSFPRRLRFDKVPLAITTRDRVLRVQFALPEQGLFSFTETKYAIQVFLAAEGSDYPGTPSFQVSSKQVMEAYPNVETWFDDVADGTAKAVEGWVTRKIDRMELPPGSDKSIRRQAFEIGAILTGYPKVKVLVIREADGTELATKEGLVTANRDWSEMISRVNDDVRRAAGHFVPMDPIVPAPGTFNPTNALAAMGGLTFRALYWLLEQNLGTELLKGLVEGFHDGWQGDKDAVVMIGRAAISPIETSKAIYGFVKDFISGLSQSGGITAIFRTLFDKLQQLELPTVGQVAYYTGYLLGFLFEQVVATVAIAVVTGGIGALVAKAATLLKGVTWLANLTQKTLSLLRSLAKALEGARQVIVDSRVARATLAWLKEIPQVVDDIWRLYPDASKIMQKAGRVAVVSKEVAQRALYWLTAVDRMVDDAAVRFITFFEKVGKEAGDRWLTRWTAFRNGKRAVKDGFEATVRSGDLPENVQDVLVTAADLNPPGVPTKNYPRDYWQKYESAPDGDRAESSLTGLRRTPTDTRFDDEAIGEAVKFHARPDVPPMSDPAVEGTARITNIRCLRFAALTILAAIIVPAGCGKNIPVAIADNFPTALRTRYDTATRNLALANDVAADEAFGRLFWAAHQAGDNLTAEAVIRAASFPAATPKSVAEYLKAVDFMRDGEDRIITGLLDAAPGKPPPFPQASINLRRVGNEGVGSLAEGWEPVAMRRLIEGGSPNLPRPITRDDIEAFGPKLDISGITAPPGFELTDSIEADCLLTDGTFFDMKHSIRSDPRVTQKQIDTLTVVLADPVNRPIKRAVFVTNGPAGDAVLSRINAANRTLRDALGIDEDLIHLVEDLGGFP